MNNEVSYGVYYKTKSDVIGVWHFADSFSSLEDARKSCTFQDVQAAMTRNGDPIESLFVVRQTIEKIEDIKR